MYFFLINLYELGQFLRIFLWISLPMMTIALLVTTYFHYRRRRGPQAGLVFSVDGYSLSTGDPEDLASGLSLTSPAAAEWAGNARETATSNVDVEWKEGADPDEIHNDNMYRGILWMKEKYERYRDLADKRYDALREELDRAEKRYQDLLAGLEEKKAAQALAGPVGRGTNTVGEAGMGDGSNDGGPGVASEVESGSEAEKAIVRDIIEEKNRQIHFLQNQLEQRIKSYHQLEYQGRDDRGRLEETEKKYTAAQEALEEKQRSGEEKDGRLDEMEGCLRIEREKVEELVAKLQHNSLLLMNIYKELDKSLNLERPRADPA